MVGNRRLLQIDEIRVFYSHDDLSCQVFLDFLIKEDGVCLNVASHVVCM